MITAKDNIPAALLEAAMTINKNEEEYNGWTNRETWLLNLWMTSDEGIYCYWREVAQSRMWKPFELADFLSEHYEDSIPESLDPFFQDIIRQAMGRVNWEEIAEALIEIHEEDD